MARQIRTVLTIAGIRGAVEPLESLLAELPDTGADVVALVGDLGAPWSKADTYRAIFKTLGAAQVPAFWVPGPADAPIGVYMRESSNLEVVYPFLHGVHGTAALGPGGHVLFAGMGGDIADDPDVIRVEEARLRYPGWEVEYRLKVINEFDADEKVFLFTTAPAHKGLHEPGSEVLAELINTHRPRLVLYAGEEPAQHQLGTSLVLCPGRFDHGEYALFDLHDRSVEFQVLAGQTTAGQTTA